MRVDIFYINLMLFAGVNLMTMRRSRTDPIDKYVGSRVRMRRLILQMSQTMLGDALGLTFQQVQKYESGANRIAASRLQQIARTLKAPVSYFFEGAPGNSVHVGKAHQPDLLEHMMDFLASRDGLTLCEAFTNIKDANLRSRIVALVEALSGRR